jgi:predicted PurR-regulated permease PerM
MIGGVLSGPLGVIIAMPVVSLSRIIYRDIFNYDKQ